MFSTASKGRIWCVQWRCQTRKGGNHQLDQSDTLSNNTPQCEATRWLWSSEWHHRSLIVPYRTFMGWYWVVHYPPCLNLQWHILLQCSLQDLNCGTWYIWGLFPDLSLSQGIWKSRWCGTWLPGSGLLLKVWKFSIPIRIGTFIDNLTDLLCSFHVTVIFGGIQWAGIWRRTESKETENRFTEESNENKCCNSPSYGWEDHTESNCVCRNSGMLFHIKFAITSNHILRACLQSGWRLTVDWGL